MEDETNLATQPEGEPEALPYRDELPDGCPPSDALLINSETVVYRFLASPTPTEDDFTSHRVRWPDKVYSGVNECDVRGLSVFDTLDETRMAKGATRLMRRMVPCKVILREGAGAISPARPMDSHRTWWPFRHYPILDCCEVVAT